MHARVSAQLRPGHPRVQRVDSHTRAWRRSTSALTPPAPPESEQGRGRGLRCHHCDQLPGEAGTAAPNASSEKQGRGRLYQRQLLGRVGLGGSHPGHCRALSGIPGLTTGVTIVSADIVTCPWEATITPS